MKLPELGEGNMYNFWRPRQTELLIDEVKTVKSGAVRFTIAIPTEGHRSGHYTCLLKDGNITVRSATDDVFYIWGNDALENEQEKIDKIIANQKGEE